MYPNGNGVGRPFLLMAGVLSAGLIATSQQASPTPLTASAVSTAQASPVPGVAATDGEKLYRNYCAVCHGAEGGGDGPAASSFDPPPPDLTDAERMGQLTDERMLEVLSNGSGVMTGFASMLTPEEVEAVAEYTRTLSEAPGDEPSAAAG
jgi:mono/diheme cytochrome c family protein